MPYKAELYRKGQTGIFQQLAIDDLATFAKGEYVLVGRNWYLIVEIGIVLSPSGHIKRVVLDVPPKTVQSEDWLNIPAD